jgi:hypothetical protein
MRRTIYVCPDCPYYSHDGRETLAHHNECGGEPEAIEVIPARLLMPADIILFIAGIVFGFAIGLTF